jgi:aldehyde dehydrogenase (NAD+)
MRIALWRLMFRFGGMGYSGIGRESGLYAVKEFTETRAVWVELSGATRNPFMLG